MTIKQGWEGLGQAWAALVGVQGQCREICRVAGVTPEILDWLNTPKGQSTLGPVVSNIIIQFRLRHDRTNTLVTDFSEFEKLVRACNFEGRSMNVNGRSHLSPGYKINVRLKFREIGVNSVVKQDEESVHAFLDANGLRPAAPVEFLLWLRANTEAGVEYPIWCPKASTMLDFAYCGRCGGGGRGLHSSSPTTTSHWPLATMFLGVEK